MAFTKIQSHQIEDEAIYDNHVATNAEIQQSKVQNLPQDLASKLNLSGGTMTGFITLHAHPVNTFHAATKQYVDDAVGDGIPTGTLLSFAGTEGNVPSGWFICNGQALSRTTYADLFSVLGTRYGTGDGSTTFNLPDLRGRTIIGVENMGGSSAGVVTESASRVLGGTSGEDRHQLSISELPAHKHTGETTTDGNHRHDYDRTAHYDGGNALINGSGDDIRSEQTSNDGAHKHNLKINNTGGNQPHNNMQPYIALNYIIKA